MPRREPGSDAWRTRDVPIACWLLVCCAMVFAMVVLGGITRLSHAGLSIVEWRPLLGVLPPLDGAAWQAAFEQYQRFPEYQKLNRGMTLAAFKDIYWLEYLHRLWGRLIGAVFLLPLVWFWLRGRLRGPLLRRLLALFALGALQGVLGWVMVESGLEDRPDVSQYRLTAHLGLALLIYALMLETAFALLVGGREEGRRPPWPATVILVLAFLVILSGGLVAGLDAGFAYNTFPLMEGRWVPAEILGLSPLWLNPFENIATVQFQHRVLAILLLAGVLGYWAAAMAGAVVPGRRMPVHLLLGAALSQVLLGVATLVSVVLLPLAAAHQAGAVLLLTAAIWARHALERPPPARACKPRRGAAIRLRARRFDA